MEKPKRVLVAGDWDADGIVSAALLVYTQEKLSLYPLKSVSIVDRVPVDPDRLRYMLNSISAPYDLVVFLDLPYVPYTGNVLKMMKQHFGVGKIMYVDHHLSTLQHEEELRQIVDVLLVDHRQPTVGLLMDELSKNGIRVHKRLESFAMAVRYMDAGKRVPPEYMKIFEITKTISKALTAVRDDELWVKIVNWLADPTPLPMPLDEQVMARVKEVIDKRDSELREVAMSLAIEAVKVGDLRFVDARKKWKKRGATALASKLASILRAPVALLVDTNKNHSLLVIKASRGRAYRMAKYLVGEGVAYDIAGHPNLAIVRVEKEIDKKTVLDALQQALFYTA
ncbi:phosphoesterase [Thermogladius sp. KZ2Tp1]|uniref:phosphoesterase n=1 Tax=unclassified Thermogladius TaxID=2647734 RepID=UPI003D10D2E3